MPPFTNIPLSPAELSYLHTSLSQTPPLRPDGRSPTDFRTLVAETDLLPSANGSARICFADGTEAVVGVKAEVERSAAVEAGVGVGGDGDVEMDDEEDGGVALGQGKKRRGRGEWLEVAIEIPGVRDDDALPVFLAAMLSEALLADGGLKERLWINSRFHWRLYVDVLLLSSPLSYPLPLLSLTTHLALLSTRLPALISEKDEDPLFNDDWEASHYLYPRGGKPAAQTSKPPFTLLIMSVGENIIFDPSRDELAVAESVLAISASPSSNTTDGGNALSMVALRTIDPPSRLTGPGVPNSITAGGTSLTAADILALREKDQGQSVWRPPRGGIPRALVSKMIKMVVEKGGVGEEVLAALAGVGS